MVVANGHAGAAPHPLVPVAVLAGHLLAAAVWAGGLAALALLALPAWRALPATLPDSQVRKALVRDVLTRFSRLALLATAVLVVTGVLGTRGNLGVLSNLWRVAYGRMLAAKLVLLAIALVFGARHLLVLPRRMAGPDDRDAVGSFERSSRFEVVVLAGAVAVAAALVSAVPARYAQLAAAHPVDARHTIGNNNVELVVAPTGPGPNQLVLSFVGDDGVLLAGVNRATATLRQPNGTVRPIDLQALSSGAFSAAVSLPTAGAYRVAVSDATGNSTTFSFQVPRSLRG